MAAWTPLIESKVCLVVVKEAEDIEYAEEATWTEDWSAPGQKLITKPEIVSPQKVLETAWSNNILFTDLIFQSGTIDARRWTMQKKSVALEIQEGEQI